MFNLEFRQTIDPSLSLAERVQALYNCVEWYSWLTRQRFQRTYLRLGADFGFDFKTPPTRESLPQVAALLQDERNAFLAKLKAFDSVRHLEKARGQRQPRKGQIEALYATDWFLTRVWSMAPVFSPQLQAQIRDRIRRFPDLETSLSSEIEEVRRFDALPTGWDMSACAYLKEDGTMLRWESSQQQAEIVETIWSRLVNLRLASRQYPELLEALPRRMERSVECEACHGRGTIDYRTAGGGGSANWPCWPCGTMGWHNGIPLFPPAQFRIFAGDQEGTQGLPENPNSSRNAGSRQAEASSASDGSGLHALKTFRKFFSFGKRSKS